MRNNKKIGLVVVAASVVGIAWLTNSVDAPQGYLPVTEQTPTPVQEALPQEEVSGVAGTYPKFLSTEDIQSGNVTLPQSDVDPQDAYDAKAEAWAKVDMTEIRANTPDNLFWVMAAPSADDFVLEQRKEKRASLKNTETKMMARHASETEIHDYYAYQMQLSEDYIEVITLLLNKYSNVIPEEDYSGQTLARSMHLRKLQELPQQMSRALDLRKDFVSMRELWLSDKDAYRAKLQAEADAANKELGNI